MLHTVFIIIFILQTLSWCQISGKFQGGIYSDRTHRYTAFQEAFQEDFEYSDFFQDHPLRPQHIGDVRTELFIVDLNWDLKSSFNPSRL